MSKNYEMARRMGNAPATKREHRTDRRTGRRTFGALPPPPEPTKRVAHLERLAMRAQMSVRMGMEPQRYTVSQGARTWFGVMLTDAEVAWTRATGAIVKPSNSRTVTRSMERAALLIGAAADGRRTTGTITEPEGQ